MSQLDVAVLLSSLREHGTIDSQGEFTISLGEARRKLTQFRSSNRRRYLLLMVSAGIGAGASKVLIRRTGATYTLSMPGAYLPESEVLGSIARSAASASSESATDLGLALQAVFAEGAQLVQILLTHPEQQSYRWSLRSDSEISEPRPAADAGIEIEVVFPQSLGDRVRGLFANFRGYAGQPEELRLLEQMCDHSPVPIVVDESSVTRPVFFPADSWIGCVGEVSYPASRNLPGEDGWSGILGLGAGALWIVVRGVTVGQVEEAGLHGVVYHDGLKLDLTREKLVTEQTYEEFLRQLERTRLSLLGSWIEGTAAQQPPGAVPSFHPLLNPAIAASLREQVSTRASCELVRWLSRGCVTAGSGPDRRAQLVGLVEDLRQRPGFAELAPVERILLEDCARELRAKSEGIPALFQLTLGLLERRAPEETLMPGYLLLGLGAYYSAKGQEGLAQDHWMRALDVVRAGDDDRAESLIHAHMDFPVGHMMEQTVNAVVMFLR